MNQVLISSFSFTNYFVPLSSNDLKENIKQGNIQVKLIKRKQFILREGEFCHSLYFILEGAFRQYSIVKGEEINFLFYFENDFILDHLSYLKNLPSWYYLEALEESKLLIINKEILSSLIVKNSSWKELWINVSNETIIRLYKRNEVLLMNTPEERYLKLLEVHPKILERVSLSKVASFIGITVPSLSRIRKRIILPPH